MVYNETGELSECDRLRLSTTPGTTDAFTKSIFVRVSRRPEWCKTGLVVRKS